jgi:hypothetical protein
MPKERDGSIVTKERQKCKLGIYYEQRKGYLDHKMSTLWVQAPTILTT